jgi:hypothetical protein
MEILNRNNYEAVYLDFLEGSLNEENTAALFAFLEENPDLKLEEELVSLEINSIKLDPAYKQSLKQVLFDEDTISISNVNSFLIAQTEGILSSKKEQELEQFIALHPVYKGEQKLFQASHLKANLEEIYTEKGALKQVIKIALWPYISAAAAACIVILLTLGNFNSKETTTNIAQATSKKNDFYSPSRKKEHTSSGFEKENKKKTIAQSTTATTTASKQSIEIKKLEKGNQTDLLQIVKVEKKKPIILPKRKVKPFQTTDPLQDLELALVLPVEIKNKNTAPEYSYLGFNEMENPIVPITNKLSNLIKTDVDFRTSKPTKKHSGGIYIKIGKFVFSRQTS